MLGTGEVSLTADLTGPCCTWRDRVDGGAGLCVEVLAVLEPGGTVIFAQS